MNETKTEHRGQAIGFRESVARAFSFDLRSLAIFRIALGCILVWDLIFRLPSVGDMCTDEGVFTREVAYQYFDSNFSNWEYFATSMHWWSGTIEWQWALMAVAAVFAVMMVLGCWTRWVTLASFVMLVSLHIRNPIILTSGDFILKLVLFWSIFLPLGRRFSVDAWRRSKAGLGESTAVVSTLSFATVGFMVQIFCLYFFTGIAKWNDDWLSGDAMYYVLRLDLFVSDLGRQLLNYPLLLKLTSWSTLAAEVFLIWLIFYPTRNSWWRMINLLVFWSFHIGIALTMDIGLFPFICLIIWLPLIPQGVWQWISRRHHSEPETESLNEVLPAGRLKSHWALQSFCAFVAFYILVWNTTDVNQTLQQLRRPEWTTVGYLLHIDQHFQMFGQPPKSSPWFVYEGLLANGETVDTFRNQSVDHERPPRVAMTLRNFHWRRYHRNLVTKPFENLRESLVDFSVREWNRSHDESHQVVQLKLICYSEDIGPDYNFTDRRSGIWGEYHSADSSSLRLDKILDDTGTDLPF